MESPFGGPKVSPLPFKTLPLGPRSERPCCPPPPPFKRRYLHFPCYPSLLFYPLPTTGPRSYTILHSYGSFHPLLLPTLFGLFPPVPLPSLFIPLSTLIHRTPPFLYSLPGPLPPPFYLFLPPTPHPPSFYRPPAASLPPYTRCPTSPYPSFISFSPTSPTTFFPTIFGHEVHTLSCPPSCFSPPSPTTILSPFIAESVSLPHEVFCSPLLMVLFYAANRSAPYLTWARALSLFFFDTHTPFLPVDGSPFFRWRYTPFFRGRARFLFFAMTSLYCFLKVPPFFLRRIFFSLDTAPFIEWFYCLFSDEELPFPL